MDYYKLLNDYLNFEGVYDDYDVLNFENRGTYIEVDYSYNDKEHRNTKNIDIANIKTVLEPA